MEAGSLQVAHVALLVRNEDGAHNAGQAVHLLAGERCGGVPAMAFILNTNCFSPIAIDVRG